MFPRSVLALVGLTSLVSGAAVNLTALDRRQNDPSPGSSVRIDFACSNVVVPMPVSGGIGGGTTSNYNIVLTNPDGSHTAPTFCRNADYCTEDCMFQTDSLPYPVKYARGCFNPAGGSCSLEFQYNGVDYSTESGNPNGQCAVAGGPEPFATDESARCYIAA